MYFILETNQGFVKYIISITDYCNSLIFLLTFSENLRPFNENSAFVLLCISCTLLSVNLKHVNFLKNFSILLQYCRQIYNTKT
jgi:hypothetical protein